MLPPEQSLLDIERARVRDLMRYYRPNILPKKATPIPSQYVDPGTCASGGGGDISIPTVADDDAPDANRLLVHDPTLTAFTQLAAYRLDCDRSFISLMDYDYQYVIAEATRSASLLTQDQCDPGDEIYLGPRALDRIWGVCPSTIQVFTARDDSFNLATPEIVADQECYIMYDMSALERFKDRPYVTKWPYMRFYAEVPITSPTGHVIGTFCVVDNKPRYDFDRKGINALKEIASAIMNHLNLVEMQRNLLQADKRLTSLGSSEGSGDKSSARKADTITTLVSPALKSDFKVSTVPQEETPLNNGDPYSLERTLSMNDDITLDEPLASTETQRMFSRACYHLREALELDGVMFIDASFQDAAFDPVSPSPQQDQNLPLNPTCKPQHCNIEGTMGNPQSAKKLDLHRQTSFADVLGCVGQDSTRAALPYSPTKIPLPRSTLRSLLLKYRDGHIFVFDEEGELLQNNRRSSDSRQPKSDQEHADDKYWAKELQKVCPGAQSVIFYPLWDIYKDQWFAGCLAWTKDFARIMQSSDVTYLEAFTSCIMSEKSRLDVVTADLQKLDFISSVSHELRNPLHGVLASTEVLRQVSSGPDQDDMIRTITVCGEVLLDTVDQILDYAKATKTTSTTNIIEPSKTGALKGADMKKMKTLDLSEVVESVIEGVFVGHHFRKSTFGVLDDGHVPKNLKMSTSCSNVIMILSIDWKASWIFKSQVGAWTRIVMNLFGNALKFTDSGYIHVSLKEVEAPAAESKTQRNIKFQVEDSGKGISQDYMKYHLFTPFVQENHMSIGTGLGLSIVHQLVANLDGKISVQSELKHGTTMTVTIPLDSPCETSSLTSLDLIHDIKARCKGLKLCLVDLDYYPDLGEEPTGLLSSHSRAMLSLKESLKAMAADWFGMEVSTSSMLTSSDGDISLILHSKVMGLEGYISERPLIVFEDVAEKRPLHAQGLHFMSMPVGPHKFARVLKHCLDHDFSPPPTVRSNSTVPVALEPLSTQPTIFSPRPNVKGAADATPEPPILGSESPAECAPIKTALIQSTDLPKRHLTPILTSGPPLSSLVAPVRTKVLLVEDNIVNLKILTQFMKMAKQDFVTATDGLEALRKFQADAGSFKIVFMDLSMPIMDGLTSTRHIRAFEAERNLPRTRIVALTCFSSDQYQREAKESGIDLYVVKPVPMKSLRPILDLEVDDFPSPGLEAKARMERKGEQDVEENERL
ncbi:hypothetical protein LZ554_008664 [Drepanopeziza brunnea f. sp. 'monogermtubi']|nr:hypothetical protein LZ554_008664 [Drepanopeziza brunnea f. sp. 'monogermtubi']